MYINGTFGKVGEKLKDLRNNNGWTLQEACDKVVDLSKAINSENPDFKVVKLNPSHLSKIERNDVDTSDYYIALLCEVYSISMSDLYKKEGSQNKNDSLSHLPLHLKQFVSQSNNQEYLNVAYQLSKFTDNEKDTILKFLGIFNNE